MPPVPFIHPVPQPRGRLSRRMQLAAITWLALAIHLPAMADPCSADAEFLHSYPSNDNNTKFKFKFKVSSDDCDRYGCSGYVHYEIHYQWKDGDSNSKSTLVSYRIRAGQRSVEVTDETYPSSVGPIKIRDIELGEISCRTP